ncbi:MAG: histidine phosphatase family protein [Propionibacteriaceae bacterium]
MSTTIVHLVRHGEVHNPTGVLYGRLPEFHLSDLGREMAVRVADHLADRDVTHLRCSPLERAQETMEPIVEQYGLPVTTDGRVIEGDNHFEGQVFSMGASALRNPRNWWHMRNPLKPSWGEPYTEIVARMRAAMKDAAAEAEGHEAIIVSHQLPVWMARCAAEGRRLVHDPRKRECTLASVTSFTYIDGRVASVAYAEPAADLLPDKGNSKKFVAGA